MLGTDRNTQLGISTNFMCDAAGALSSQLCVPTLIWCLFHPCVTTVACKTKSLWPFCQKCRWQVTPKHAYTIDPTKLEWAYYAAVQAQCGNLSGNKLTRNSSGNTRSQSAQQAEPLWTDPSLKSENIVRDLISTFKTNKKRVKSYHHHHNYVAIILT